LYCYAFYIFIIKVDGSWSVWSNWSACSVTCDDGHQERRRTCSDPSPQHGGSICLGNETESMICDSGVLCPGKLYLRLIQ